MTEPSELTEANRRQRMIWRKQAPRYDKSMGFFERHLFGDAREWVSGRATGDVLEIAIGTALNLPSYPADVRLTGVDLSPEMLAIARARAAEVGVDVDLSEGDAHDLAFPDASFDSVVCTFSLCTIPDPARAVAEMRRVLRPGGRLLLADHVISTNRALIAVQRLLELVARRFSGDQFTRRSLPLVTDAGFQIEVTRRHHAGIVELIVAHKPEAGDEVSPAPGT